MTKRHRSFEVKVQKELTEDEQITFDLGDESFTARPDLQGAVILDFIAAADENTSKAAGKILEFFEHALPEDEHKRFKKLIHNPDKIVDMETLSGIVAWLIEEYTARPTQE